MRAIGKMCSIGVLLRVRVGVGVGVRVRLQVVVRVVVRVRLVVVVVVAVADDAAEVRYTDEKEEKSSAECGVRAVAMWWSVRETMMRW